MSYFALIIKYKNGGYSIPDKKYPSRKAAKRSAARRLRRNNRIDQIYLIEQLSIFEIYDIDVRQYV